jgi:(E)-4-hydroxy-3-methylbut-2-enyl-diphosphate synthase
LFLPSVKFIVSEAEATDRLKDLIREHGKWIDAAPQGSALEIVS